MCRICSLVYGRESHWEKRKKESLVIVKGHRSRKMPLIVGTISVLFLMSRFNWRAALGCSLGTTLSVDPEALPATSLLVGQQDSVAASPWSPVRQRRGKRTFRVLLSICTPRVSFANHALLSIMGAFQEHALMAGSLSNLVLFRGVSLSLILWCRLLTSDISRISHFI